MNRYLVNFLMLLSIFMFSCEKEGCRDENALNFDKDAEKDGNCAYSRVIFYASADSVVTDMEELPIDSISVYNGNPNSGGTLVNTTSILNRPEPTDCLNSSDRIVFIFENSETFEAYKVYHLKDGGDYEPQPESYEPKTDAECIIIDLTSR